jgi:hypothetical protein
MVYKPKTLLLNIHCKIMPSVIFSVSCNKENNHNCIRVHASYIYAAGGERFARFSIRLRLSTIIDAQQSRIRVENNKHLHNLQIHLFDDIFVAYDYCASDLQTIGRV